jgi:DNA mismatch endonuclease, patch repair protein
MAKTDRNEVDWRMTDVLTWEQRHRCMSSVRSKDTGPEMLLRSVLHRAGLRYRLHDGTLPGSPDLAFPRFRAAVFVHGCYWHSHGCYKSTVPKSRRAFWEAKFSANRERDERNIRSLRERGWRIMIVWECALKGKTSWSAVVVANTVKEWLQSSEDVGGIPNPAYHLTMSNF